MVTLLIIVLLTFGLLMGLRRGFVMQVVHLIGFFVSFIIATIFYKKLASHLSLWIPYPELSSDSAWALFLNTMPLENAFYNAIAFGIIFFLAKVILQTIGYMVDFIASFPVLRSINRLLGAVLGFVEMYIISFIGLFFLALLPISSIQDKINGSFLAKFIVLHTPILSKLTEFLFFTDSLSQVFL